MAARAADDEIKINLSANMSLHQHFTSTSPHQHLIATASAI